MNWVSSKLLVHVFIVLSSILSSCGSGGGGGDSASGNSPVPNWIGVTLKNSSYRLEKIMNTSFGLPSQIAALPDGRIVIADSNNNRIVMIDGEKVKILEKSYNLYALAVATQPNGNVCFSNNDGDIWTLNPDTLEKHRINTLPDGVYPQALVSDDNGIIYVGASDMSVYAFDNGSINKVASNIGYYAIDDIEVAEDNTIYISGPDRVIAYKNGIKSIVVDGLHWEPVWIEIDTDGILYINEPIQGLQAYDPYEKTVTKIKPDNFNPFGDIISKNPDRIIFYDFEVFYEYDFQTKTGVPIFKIIGNGFSLSVDKNDTAYFETPGKYNVLEQHIVNIEQNGLLTYRDDLSFKGIFSTSIDYENRLCLLTDEGFKRIESNGQITNIAENLDFSKLFGLREFSVGPDGLWYIITTDGDDKIQVSRFDETGNFEELPISFNRLSFGGASVSDASIDIGFDGSIAVIVTAMVSITRGPFLQRVYRAGKDGEQLDLCCEFRRIYCWWDGGYRFR